MSNVLETNSLSISLYDEAAHNKLDFLTIKIIERYLSLRNKRYFGYNVLLRIRARFRISLKSSWSIILSYLLIIDQDWKIRISIYY
jgi:hypothetical protein